MEDGGWMGVLAVCMSVAQLKSSYVHFCQVFGITFRTPPADSTGVPHILEHSVLCGSRKFPVKEPFVDLLKGSLQTFLNAFTYPDRTCAWMNVLLCMFVGMRACVCGWVGVLCMSSIATDD